MRVEFIELLRCPAAHHGSPLITVAHARRGDDIIDATLGCVVCRAEYVLHDGCVRFSSTDGADTRNADRIGADRSGEALRLAALLALAEPTARALLCGETAAVAYDIESLTGARCLALNGRAEDGTPPPTDRLSMQPRDRIPLGDACLHGLAVDAAHRALLADATRVVRRGGRLVAPVIVPLPDGCRELARDARQWVAEVEATQSALVTLERAAGLRRDTQPR